MISKLDIEFNEVFKGISETKEKLPTDVQLRLYAYYKQAIKGDTFVFDSNKKESDIRKAFKFNAWIQLKGMSEDEAKKEYINLANEILNR